ncbi:hypothetical protein QSJ19_12075 [Gordonia sp. ABSL11-1]|uniref:hypothetical protein n=1 Tax=Gordonia sp. ABSL11-1 TaxID=3053924 RepID=UPI00257276A5|nr:hypothetical protein [Gordonia sp. ABSL11-1]MDL9946320.1 hypothetical protein [Gordonia sp. ABSL11-1]
MRKNLLGLIPVIGAAAGLGFGAGTASAALPPFELSEGAVGGTSLTVNVTRDDAGGAPYVCIGVAKQQGLPDGVNVSIPSNPTLVGSGTTGVRIAPVSPTTDYTVTVTCTGLGGVASESIDVTTTTGGGGGGGTGSLSF